ncbi:MAG: aminoglycoside phosphotransferase family protein [Anaerolineaceae bacterium]|nr:aminoglycoside phosphotransferase family protein [Anaerolineaceae bacterium]
MQRLLPAVAAAYQHDADEYYSEGWQITRISGGANGIVYKAQSEQLNQRDLAVKITQEDGRHRTEREYAATLSLRLAGYDVCPHPIYQRASFPGLPGQILVSEWLAGKRLETPPPPENRKTWTTILDALGEAHTLTPERSRVYLRPAFFGTDNPGVLMMRIKERLDKLPEGMIGGLRREQMERLMQAATDRFPAPWEQPVDQRLIIDDVNPKNMIEKQGMIRFVDWEYAGWADPAFDIAGLCSQPAYFDLPDEHREWLKTEHSLILDDKDLPHRATVYEQLMLIFWVIRMSQSLVALDNRFEGVQRFPQEYHESFQMRYWERAVPLFGL